MRTVNPTLLSALQARSGVVVRDFVWVEARNRSTGETETAGFWSGAHSTTLDVISGKDQTTVERSYNPGGGLISVSPITATMDLTIQQVTITLSQIDQRVIDAVLGYDVRQASVEIHRGFLSTATREMIAPPDPVFVGRVDRAPVTTPPAGEEGKIDLICSSDLREMTRTNPALKSDTFQKLRDGDTAREYISMAGNWRLFWGEKRRLGKTSKGAGGSLRNSGGMKR